MSHQSELISTDIHAYLAQHERKELLRFLTCGSVDDGKSTLIGRLLHDSKMIYEDQLAAIHRDSKTVGSTGGDIDLALLVDGLQAEREQGITIDVAYRYFSTPKRKFIIADTPGHEQYTRNMATGASTCDLAIILIDARHGMQAQTKRHSFIVSLLGLKQVVVAVNKMDLVGYDRAVFEQIRRDYVDFATRLEIPDIRFIPLSALKGDNVVNPSPAMTWYEGQALMDLLNGIEISRNRELLALRFPVQYVNRPNQNFRGYSGTIAAGVVRKGDELTVLPSRKSSRVKSIVTYDGELSEAFPGQAVTLTLEDEVDISRGDLLVNPNELPSLSSRFNANLVWMTDAPLIPGKQYYFKQATKTVTGAVSQIHYRTDVNTLKRQEAGQLKLNEIGLCEVALNAAIAFDPYARCKGGGSFIVIDRLTHVTVGAGMIVGEAEPVETRRLTPEERSARFGQKALTFWLTGARRVETAYRLERGLFDLGHASIVLDEEMADAEAMANKFNQAGLICLCALEGTAAEEGTHRVLAAETAELDEILKLVSLHPASGGQPEYVI
ncbi:MAG: sulfate adenylyltransferase subunit CysN [Methylococcaceae bacterium]|nr:sulfate adenylyltransferase subunit CysN [Methylococcaceae bacterium]